jgi:hypothetical protein
MSSGRTWKKKKEWFCRKLKNQILRSFIETETEDHKLHTSGTPPTLVLTVNSPQLAASRMAIQNASVRELKITKGCVSVLLLVIHKMVTPLHMWHEKLCSASFSVALCSKWQGRCKMRRKKNCTSVNPDLPNIFSTFEENLR